MSGSYIAWWRKRRVKVHLELYNMTVYRLSLHTDASYYATQTWLLVSRPRPRLFQPIAWSASAFINCLEIPATPPFCCVMLFRLFMTQHSMGGVGEECFSRDGGGWNYKNEKLIIMYMIIIMLWKCHNCVYFSPGNFVNAHAVYMRFHVDITIKLACFGTNIMVFKCDC